MNLKIALAQTPFFVGDIAANIKTIVESALYARDELGAELIVFPELTVTGYPAEDLLLRRDFIELANNAIYEIAEQVADIALVIGYPERDGDKLYNSAVVINQGAIVTTYRKQALPNYGVFDEQRYFTAGDAVCLFEFNGAVIGVSICEDVWHEEIVKQNKEAGADLLLTLNASPFHSGKIYLREEVVCNHAKSAQLPIVYVNQVGGQDELIFDGVSFVVNKDGDVFFRAEEFKNNSHIFVTK